MFRLWQLAFACLVIALATALPVAAAQAEHSTGARAITDIAYHQSTLLFDALRRACDDATFFTLPNAPHGFVGDPPGLEDPAVTAGATVESTRHCRASRPRPLEPSWEEISRWLRHELDGRGSSSGR